MKENKIKCCECGKKYNPNKIKIAICKKCDKKLEMPINKKVYFGITFTIFIICGIFWWEFLSTFLIGLFIGLLFGGVYFSKDNNKQSPTSQTKSLRDFPKGEHNISLKDNSNKLSQISSNDETSLNNNIHRLRPNLKKCSKEVFN